jgi:hypothetical protein
MIMPTVSEIYPPRPGIAWFVPQPVSKRPSPAIRPAPATT